MDISVLRTSCLLGALALSPIVQTVASTPPPYQPYQVYDAHTLTGDPNAGWMPMGLFRGYDTTSLYHIGNWGPQRNAVVISPFSTVAQPTSRELPLSYEQATDFLPLDINTPGVLKSRPTAFDNNVSLTYSEYPDWKSPEWTRNYILQIATALTRTEYSGQTRYTPYKDANGNMGMDCSNFTTFIYNYALGHYFTSLTTTQGGQISSGGQYYTPNYPYHTESSSQYQANLTQLYATKSAGSPICLNGNLANPNDGCGLDQFGVKVPFISAYNSSGTKVTNYFQNNSAAITSALKPGDLVFFDWHTDKKLDHVAIWTGVQSGNNWIIIHSSTENLGDASYPIVVEYTPTKLSNMWSARRVITDNPADYLNREILTTSQQKVTYTPNMYATDDKARHIVHSYGEPTSSVAVNKRGDRIIAYESDNDIIVNFFTHTGTSHYGLRMNATSGQHRAPDVAIDNHGKAVVVWEDDTDLNGYNEVSMTVLDTNLGWPIRVQQQVVNSVASGAQNAPSVAIMEKSGSTSDIVVAWEDDKDNNGYYEIMASAYDLSASNTLTTGPFSDRVVNNVGTGQQRNPDVEMDMYSNFVVVWEDNRVSGNFSNIAVRGFWANGNARYPGHIVHTNTSWQQKGPKVAIASHRSYRPYIVTWQDDNDNNGYYEIFAVGFNSGTHDGSYHGNLVTVVNEFVVNSVPTGNQITPDVAIDQNTGQFVIAWQDIVSGNTKLKARGFNIDGSQLFADRDIGPAQLSNPPTVDALSEPTLSMVDIGEMVLGYNYQTNAASNSYYLQLDTYHSIE